MAGIPVHTSSPINARASISTASTTSTTASKYTPTSTSASENPFGPPITTPSAPSSVSYTLAQPGAVPGPAPTSTIASYPNAYNPTSTATIPTQTHSPSDPAPPQPGAVPTPFGYSPQQAQNARKASIPPPPKANEIPQPGVHYSPAATPKLAAAQPTPSAFQIPVQPLLPHQQLTAVLGTPTRAQPVSSSTSSDLSNPPGYLQNVRASFDSMQPAYRDPVVFSPFSNSTNRQNSPTRPGGGLLDTGMSDDASNERGIWDAAKNWAKTAGEKLKEGEEGAWKFINEKSR